MLHITTILTTLCDMTTLITPVKTSAAAMLWHLQINNSTRLYLLLPLNEEVITWVQSYDSDFRQLHKMLVMCHYRNITNVRNQLIFGGTCVEQSNKHAFVSFTVVSTFEYLLALSVVTIALSVGALGTSCNHWVWRWQHVWNRTRTRLERTVWERERR